MEAILFPASNLNMFCSSCGQNCPLEAKYCNKCGDLLKQNVTEGAGGLMKAQKKMKVVANLVPLKWHWSVRVVNLRPVSRLKRRGQIEAL